MIPWVNTPVANSALSKPYTPGASVRRYTEKVIKKRRRLPDSFEPNPVCVPGNLRFIWSSTWFYTGSYTCTLAWSQSWARNKNTGIYSDCQSEKRQVEG